MSDDSERTELPLLKQYLEHGVPWGYGDLYAAGDVESFDLIAEIQAVFSVLMTEDEHRFEQFMVLVPEDSRLATQFEQYQDFVSMKMKGFVERGAHLRHPPPAVQLTTVKSDGFGQLLELVKNAKARTAVFVADAGRFRNQERTISAELPALLEATWPAHVCDLMNALVSEMKDRAVFAVIDVCKALPETAHELSLLMSVEEFGVFGKSTNPEFDGANDPERWVTMAQGGNVVGALAELENRIFDSRAEKLLIRIALLASANFVEQARNELQSFLLSPPPLNNRQRLTVAFVASTTGLDDVGTTFVREALMSGPLESHEIDRALQIAEILNDNVLTDEILSILETSFPDSAELRRVRIEQYINNGEFASALKALNQAPDADEMAMRNVLTLAEVSLGDPARLKIDAFLNDVSTTQPESYEVALRLAARSMGRQGDFAGALVLLVTHVDDPASEDVIRLALYYLRQALLHSANAFTAVQLSMLLATIFRSLARRPTDSRTRLSLMRVLSPQLLGAELVPIVITVLLQLAKESARPTELGVRKTVAATPQELKEFAERGRDWIENNGISVVGGQRAPESILTAPAASLIVSMQTMLVNFASKLAPGGDVSPILVMLGLITAITQYSTNPDDDLTTFRIVAVRLAEGGFTQTARDLAEQALQSAGEDPARMRRAWYAYADIHARLGETTEAAVALALATAVHDSPTWHDVWQESTLAFRILRNNGLAALGSPFLNAIREAIAALGLQREYLLRVQTAEMQSFFMDGTVESSTDEEAERYVGRLAEHVHEVIQHESEQGPVGAMLGSAIRLLSERGLQPNVQADNAFAQIIGGLREPLKSLVILESSRFPTLQQLVAVANSLQAPRYGENVGYDTQNLAIFARRSLANIAVESAELAAYGIEAMCDGTVLPADVPDLHLLKTDHAVLAAAEQYSLQGIDVVMIGISSRGLVKLVISNGVAAPPVLEAQSTFSAARLRNWKEQFPYAYAQANAANLFYTSTEAIGFTTLPARCVVVSDVSLQAFPVNLFNVEEELAGSSKALACAPSLSWLNHNRSLSCCGHGRAVAWIPASNGEETYPALEILAERLAPSLLNHRVSVNTAREIPTDIAGADLCIIAAHGGTTSDNHYFRVVQTDDGRSMGPALIVSAAANCCIVVLFVCSGGRIDRHPESTSVLGVAKSLLQAGCSAVVAPPWPLETSVPPVWLPAFLESLRNGQPVIDASFAANKRVREKLSADARLCLAMTVYGNPLATIRPQ